MQQQQTSLKKKHAPNKNLTPIDESAHFQHHQQNQNHNSSSEGGKEDPYVVDKPNEDEDPYANQ